jgi:hypothetical protein
MKPQAELAVSSGATQNATRSADRATFERNEANWREELAKEVAEIKDSRTRLGMQARSTWYHIEDVRNERLPVYEEPKSPAEKHSQP